MTKARHRGFWQRIGLAGGTGAALLLAAAAPGCGSETEPRPSSGSTSTSSAASTSAGTGGAGGTGEGGAGGGGVGGGASEISEVAKVNTPFDATPDPEGGIVYISGIGSKGAAIFKAPAAGGAPQEIVSGEPLVSPFGIASSTDGVTLYIADSGANDPNDNDQGQIFSLAVTGNALKGVNGSGGTRPRSLEIVQEDNADVIYFTGVNKGVPGLFKIPAAGGVISVVAQGNPFVDPSGVTVASNGDAFVVDTAGSTKKTALILRVAGGTASTFLTDIRVGYPAGIALTKDDQTLLVSGLDPVTGTDVILKISVGSKAVEVISKGLEGFSEPAGMHRAKTSNTFSWADSKANNGGTVFKFTP